MRRESWQRLCLYGFGCGPALIGLDAIRRRRPRVLREAVAPASDVSGDGYADVFVGAPGATLACRAPTRPGFSFSARAASPRQRDIFLLSDEDAAGFAHSVATAGDVHGDGFSDLIIGSYVHGARAGAARSRTSLRLPGLKERAFQVAAWFATGDESDARAGTPWARPGTSTATATPTSSSAPTNTTQAEARMRIADAPICIWGRRRRGRCLRGPLPATPTMCSSGNPWPVQVTSMDGYSDVVRANRHDGVLNRFNRGRAYLSRLARRFECGRVVDGFGRPDRAELGYSVASAGDVNGDGYSDVLVGAPFHDGGGPRSTHADVSLPRRARWTGEPAWTASGEPTQPFWHIRSVSGRRESRRLLRRRDWYRAQRRRARSGQAYLCLGSPSGLSTSPSWTSRVTRTAGVSGFPSRRPGT